MTTDINHYSTDCCGVACPNEPGNIPARSHLFFEDLAKEARKAHFGEQSKQWTANLLKRATEAGLYAPPETP